MEAATEDTQKESTENVQSNNTATVSLNYCKFNRFINRMLSNVGKRLIYISCNLPAFDLNFATAFVLDMYLTTRNRS